MLDVVIRDARADELDAIAAVLLAAYEQYFPTGDLSPEERAAWDGYRVDIADVASRMGDSEQIVAELAGAMIGSVTFYPPNHAAHYPNRSETHDWPPEWASFRLLGVDPAARGRGVGRILTDECIRRARAYGAPVLALHTTYLMDVAREMYQRMGWKRVTEYDFFPMPDFTVEAYALEL